MSYKVTRKELASFLECDLRTISNYVKAGMPELPSDSSNPKATRYLDAAEALQWHMFRRWDKERSGHEAALLKVQYLLESQEYYREKLAKYEQPTRPTWIQPESAGSNGADAP